MNSYHDRSYVDPPSNRQSKIDSRPCDDRLVAALEEYVELLRDGWRPDRAEFLARHHSIGDILGDRIDDLEFVQGAISHLAATGPHGAQELLIR